MAKHRDFEFNLRELAGSMGDFGTLFPLAIGYIVVCGLDPAGLFIWMGLVNIATAALIRDYFPDKPVKEERLMLNMGFMNVIPAFFGGMPLCHGAGGLAGQYYFGARTGGTNIIEGLIEISLGLFLGKSIGNLLAAFPMPLVGAMMFLVGIELGKVVVGLRGWKLWLALVTAATSVITNMAVGFIAGLAAAYLVRELTHRHLLSCVCLSRALRRAP
jgi:MFS superfamily sulfate permease-like transporter